MITDMEGVDGLDNCPEQCVPFSSPRWAESQKLLADEVNAAVDGLFAGGATDVIVADLHDSDRSLSVLTIDSRARLLTGNGIPPTLGLDSSYSAVVFIGQHPMAGAEKGVLTHSYSADAVQNLWINDQLVGEIGARTMLAGYYKVPVIMLSGDAAACRELHALAPKAECAVVMEGLGGGFGHSAAVSLSNMASCRLIREKAEHAMKNLAAFEPYKIHNPVEIKIEFTAQATPVFWPQAGVRRLDERTYLYSGKDFLDAWLKQPL
jgi:D-amino peptidase